MANNKPQRTQVNTTQKVEDKVEDEVETPAPTLEEKTEEENEGHFKVETTGEFGLYDPIARLDIPHNKAIMVTRTVFIDRQINLKRLVKVK